MESGLAGSAFPAPLTRAAGILSRVFDEGDVLADDVAEAIFRGRNDFDALLADEKVDVGLTDGDGAAGIEVGLADANAVDRGAVGGAEITEQVTLLVLLDPAVKA